MKILSSNWVRSLFLILTILVIVAGVAISLTAPIGKWLAEDWLHQQGLEGQIGSVKLDLSDGIIQINDISFHSESNGNIQLDELYLIIGLAELFENKVMIKKFHIKNLTIDSVFENGTLLAVAGLALTQQNTSITTTEEQTTPWFIQLEEIKLDKIRSCMIDKAMGDAVTPTDIDIKTQLINSCTLLEQLDWHGGILISTKNTIQASGKLSINDFEIIDYKNNRQIAGFKQFLLSNLSLHDPENISAETIELKNVKYLQHIDQPNNTNFEFEKLFISRPQYKAGEAIEVSATTVSLSNTKLIQIPQSDDYLVNIDDFSISDPNLQLNSSQQLMLKDVNIRGLDSRLEIQADKSITGSPPTPSSDTPKNNNDQSRPFIFSIDHIRMDGNSKLHFIDASVEPAIDIYLSNIDIALDNIVSNHKDQVSNLKASISIGDHGKLISEGVINLFAERPTLNLQQNLTGFDLSLVNTYFKTFIGHRVHHGHLDISQHMLINQGQLDIDSSLLLRKFKIESLDSEQAQQYKSELGIPLSAALNLLRDNDDNIRLKLPVSGDINSPNFSINDILMKVSGKAIKEAVINYYTPYGLVKLGSAIFDLATALRFDPILFEPGQSELDATDGKELATLAQALDQRPKVELVLCGSPTLKDRFAVFGTPTQQNVVEPETTLMIDDQQQKQLFDLMNQRKKNVKNYLVEQLKIDANRLIICNEADKPEWQTLPELEPRVTLSL